MKPETFSYTLFAGVAALLLFLSACDGGSTPFDVNRGNPVDAQIVSDTTGLSDMEPGATVEVAVKLTDAFGKPSPDREVAWTPADEDRIVGDATGSVADSLTITDADGVARTIWTLGADTASTYTLDVVSTDVTKSPAPGSSGRPLSPNLTEPDVRATVR